MFSSLQPFFLRCLQPPQYYYIFPKPFTFQCKFYFTILFMISLLLSFHMLSPSSVPFFFKLSLRDGRSEAPLRLPPGPQNLADIARQFFSCAPLQQPTFPVDNIHSFIFAFISQSLYIFFYLSRLPGGVLRCVLRPPGSPDILDLLPVQVVQSFLKLPVSSYNLFQETVRLKVLCFQSLSGMYVFVVCPV